MADELTVMLDEADFAEAYRPAPGPHRLRTLVLILAMMLAMLIVALLVRFPDARVVFRESPLVIGLAGAVIVAAALLILLLISAPVLRRLAGRRIVADHPGMRDPVHYEFDAVHFAVRTTFSQARYPWAQLWDWRESERVLIVLPTPQNFYVLPKRGVDPAVLNRLRGYLAQARKRTTIG